MKFVLCISGKCNSCYFMDVSIQSLPQSQVDQDRWCPSLANDGLGIVVLSLVLGLVNVLKVKHLTHVDWQDPHIVLSKCLTCTDSLACWEWHPCKVVSFLAIWGEVKWALGIESFRKELIWSLPLWSVVVESEMLLEEYFVTFQELVLANLNVLFNVIWSSWTRWIFKS